MGILDEISEQLQKGKKKQVIALCRQAIDEGIPAADILNDGLMPGMNVIGVKFTIRDYFEMRKTKEVNGGDINLINGPDETLLCGLVMGADGGIGTTYNIMPEWYVGLYDAFVRGDWHTAQEYQYRCNRVTDALSRHSRHGAIPATKAALCLKGYDVGSAVFPSREFDRERLAALKKELSELGISF